MYGVVACFGVDVGGAVACFQDDVLGFDLLDAFEAPFVGREAFFG